MVACLAAVAEADPKVAGLAVPTARLAAVVVSIAVQARLRAAFRQEAVGVEPHRSQQEGAVALLQPLRYFCAIHLVVPHFWMTSSPGCRRAARVQHWTTDWLSEVWTKDSRKQTVEDIAMLMEAVPHVGGGSIANLERCHSSELVDDWPAILQILRGLLGLQLMRH